MPYSEAAPRQGGGRLMIIGGHEDRKHDMAILRRFVEFAGGPDRRIVVLTAATKVPGRVWEEYDRAFAELGVRDRAAIHTLTRAQANDPALAEQVASAQGIFMAGGSQLRLMKIIGNTVLHAAMRQALTERGACIGGTSAGASAMSAHMLASGKASLQPEKGGVRLSTGLSFVQGAVIDQHFSQRRRLARLLAAVAHYPRLAGIGVDENTALVIGPDAGIEVIGEGGVTIVDGRQMHANLSEVAEQGKLQLIDVKLHLLPAGAAHRPGSAAGPIQDFLELLTGPDPLT
jgi:cyanophycinase